MSTVTVVQKSGHHSFAMYSTTYLSTQIKPKVKSLRFNLIALPLVLSRESNNKARTDCPSRSGFCLLKNPPFRGGIFISLLAQFY
ncbi:hypothetical protein THOD04_80167 [Vibrio owensii]|nr:hypothetical protein THOD04_80167 [Vibrio owensii]